MRALWSYVVFSGFPRPDWRSWILDISNKCPKSGSELQTWKSYFLRLLQFMYSCNLTRLVNKDRLRDFLHDFIFVIDKLPAAAHRLAHHP